MRDNRERCPEPERDPETWVGFWDRLLRDSGRTWNLLMIALTVGGIALGVAAELRASGHPLGGWTLTGVLSGVAASVMVKMVRALVRRYSSRPDLGRPQAQGCAEEPDPRPANEPPTPDVNVEDGDEEGPPQDCPGQAR